MNTQAPDKTTADHPPPFLSDFDFLSREAIEEQKTQQQNETKLADAVRRGSQGPVKHSPIVPIAIDLTNAEVLDNDQPLDVKTRLGTFTIPLWLTAEVMNEISVRHNAIEKAETKPPGWTPTIWWDEVRAYLESNGMAEGLTVRELLLFWKHFWDTVRAMGKP